MSTDNQLSPRQDVSDIKIRIIAEDTDIADAAVAALQKALPTIRMGRQRLGREDEILVDGRLEVSLPTRSPEAPMPTDEHHGRCRSCQADVIWGKTAAGRSAPFDINPDGSRGALHFTTCPDATQWSGRNRRQ